MEEEEEGDEDEDDDEEVVEEEEDENEDGKENDQKETNHIDIIPLINLRRSTRNSQKNNNRMSWQ